MAFTLALVFTAVVAMTSGVPTYKQLTRPTYGAASVRHAVGTGLVGHGHLDAFNPTAFVNEKVYGVRRDCIGDQYIFFDRQQCINACDGF